MGDGAEFEMFRDTARRFFECDCVPQTSRWEAAGAVDRAAWRRAGALGLLCPSVPEAFGGAGGDFRHEKIVFEEQSRAGISGFGLGVHSGIVTPYLVHYGSTEQKRRWLPGLVSGDLVAAIAMTEPAAGSDLKAVATTARRDGNHYRVSGTKTFISNGQSADLICVVVKTDPALGTRGISLLMVETEGLDGFRRGRNLDKLGMHGQDTSELFFDEVRVPVANLLGPSAGLGFQQLMEQLPRERLIIAIAAVEAMDRAIDLTIDYTRQRNAFGRSILDFQNTRFKLAEARTEARLARVFVEDCTRRLLDGTLDATTAAMAKWWCTEAQCRIVDECLQLHGGYGYMREYPIAALWADSRVQKIYGGTNEIMKELIGRSL